MKQLLESLLSEVLSDSPGRHISKLAWPHWVALLEENLPPGWTITGSSGVGWFVSRSNKVKEWRVGDVWINQFNQQMEVVEIRDDGMAMLQMIWPIKTHPCSQKEIPAGWFLKTTP